MTDTPIPPPAPRTFRARVIVLFVVAAAAIAGAAGYFAGARGGGSVEVAAAKVQYQCPMHPTIVQDHPGDCPICGMKLVKMTGAAGGGVGATASKERKVKFYRSPMDPKQTSPVPRKDEMGMDFVPVYEDEAETDVGSSVEGLSTVTIDPGRQQLIGLKTAEVARSNVAGSWRTVGRVAIDETRVRHINVKTTVYVERIYVDFIGKAVRKGAPLFSAYSPELLAAQEEYRLALTTQKALSSAELGVNGSGLAAAARRKLELYDVPESAIKRLEKTGQPTKTITFSSPIAGVVTKKDVVEGMKLEAGAMPYEIVDLSKVWVLADVYESDLRHVKVGMQAKLTLKAFPNRVFDGTVDFIDPILDPRTRTVKVRLVCPNKTGELKPEMFAEVVLEGLTREGLRIPEDAVIDSGTKSVVFVAIGDGKFQPREVLIGESDGAYVEVVSGLSAGEKVVVRANFLVDSESRLRASLAALSAPAPTASSAAPPSSVAPAASSGPRSTRTPNAPAPSAQATERFACPMHPEVTNTKPSRCPKCGMLLVPSGK